MTIGEIVRHLEHDHIKAPGGDTWYHGTVLRMLQNEKYKGDLLLQKSYTVDFLTKKRSRNNGVLPQYYVENAHEPIIPREIFLITQGELLRRKQEREAMGKQRLPSREYAMMDKLVCGYCGAAYVRKASKKYGTVWRCGTRCTTGRSCDGLPVSEAASINHGPSRIVCIHSYLLFLCFYLQLHDSHLSSAMLEICRNCVVTSALLDIYAARR
jgi:hypothetical protein